MADQFLVAFEEARRAIAKIEATKISIALKELRKQHIYNTKALKRLHQMRESELLAVIQDRDQASAAFSEELDTIIDVLLGPDGRPGVSTLGKLALKGDSDEAHLQFRRECNEMYDRYVKSQPEYARKLELERRIAEQIELRAEWDRKLEETGKTIAERTRKLALHKKMTEHISKEFEDILESLEIAQKTGDYDQLFRPFFASTPNVTVRNVVTPPEEPVQVQPVQIQPVQIKATAKMDCINERAEKTTVQKPETLNRQQPAEATVVPQLMDTQTVHGEAETMNENTGTIEPTEQRPVQMYRKFRRTIMARLTERVAETNAPPQKFEAKMNRQPNAGSTIVQQLKIERPIENATTSNKSPGGSIAAREVDQVVESSVKQKVQPTVSRQQTAEKTEEQKMKNVETKSTGSGESAISVKNPHKLFPMTDRRGTIPQFKRKSDDVQSTSMVKKGRVFVNRYEQVDAKEKEKVMATENVPQRTYAAARSVEDSRKSSSSGKHSRESPVPGGKQSPNYTSSAANRSDNLVNDHEQKMAIKKVTEWQEQSASGRPAIGHEAQFVKPEDRAPRAGGSRTTKTFKPDPVSPTPSSASTHYSLSNLSFSENIPMSELEGQSEFDYDAGSYYGSEAKSTKSGSSKGRKAEDKEKRGRAPTPDGTEFDYALFSGINASWKEEGDDPMMDFSETANEGDDGFEFGS